MLSNKFKTSNLQRVFYGYCYDTLFSALLYLTARKAMKANEYQDEEKKEPPQTTNLNAIQFDDKELESKLCDLFNPLCRPEKIVKTKIKDLEFYCFGSVVESQRKKSKDQMLMVVTTDMEHNIPMEWVHCIKKIPSFKKVEQFEKMINEFFENEISNDVLILQCRYTLKSKDQLEQIMHILQFGHYRFYNDPKNSQKQKLVVLLIHSKTRSGRGAFPLIFRQFKIINFFKKNTKQTLFFFFFFFF
ncbi:hypothetical protein RFI_04470 [Reticulomyxa filosa]|uniref:Uncharacterized protein n=1 Tax=Reticulomyxa filosa TaxID=46433 RepID=X6P344_RETFI|nr:hypothetical protein RFI_04470 [Reticulomyxa filosa]|eukprot:ETO32646.1 hypothetical protein RFI_04470 [Reticulomyxa filosa]